MISGAKYVGIDDRGLTIDVKGKQQLLEVDNIVLCAGQESLKNLVAPLQGSGKPVFLIGGAELAAELDAKRAIDQVRLASEAVSAHPCVTLFVVFVQTREQDLQPPSRPPSRDKWSTDRTSTRQ